jgi:hypothetical protein
VPYLLDTGGNSFMVYLQVCSCALTCAFTFLVCALTFLVMQIGTSSDTIDGWTPDVLWTSQYVRSL